MNPRLRRIPEDKIRLEKVLRILVELYDHDYYELYDDMFPSLVETVMDDIQDIAQFSDDEIERAEELGKIANEIEKTNSMQTKLFIKFFKKAVELLV